LPSFEYTASDRTGAITKGTLEARTQAKASQELGSMGLFVLEIKPAASASKRPVAVEQSPPTAKSTTRTTRGLPDKPQTKQPPKVLPTVVSHAGDKAPAPPKKGSHQRFRFRRVTWSPLQRALYLRQLSTMFDAGIPLHKATELLTENPEYPPELQKILDGIPRDLERGRMLSKSLEKSKLFGRLVVSSVSIGEQSGRLDEILAGLADGEEQSVKLKRTLISKLTYPCVVMVVMTIGLIVLGHVMSRVMASMPGFDPGSIPIFGIVTSFFQHPAFLPVCFLLLATIGLLCWKTYVTPSWRVVLETAILNTPVVGNLLARVESNTITCQMSLLISAGIPIDRTLELCSDLVWTELFRRALVTCKAEIRHGASIGESFELSGLFPDDVLALITAGEMSGTLEKSLKKAADYCADQVERTLETALSLLEPLLIGTLGIAIGTVILCTFVPVFNQIQTM